MRAGKRNIRDGHEFERFFKRASGMDITVKKEALLIDTIKWIKVVVDKTLSHTAKIAEHLRAGTMKKTCKRIWDFCYHHFQYEKDEERKEQIRSPRRSWMDRHDHKGIDCDDFTVMICSILENLNIPHLLRITKYPRQDEFSHIYPVAISPEGQEVIIDCVVDEFNYEVPYIEKKDEEMELQILNGFEDEDDFDEYGEVVSFDNDLSIDAADLFLDEDMELAGLAGRAERKARQAARKAKRNRPKSVKKAERKTNLKKFVEDFKKGNLKDKLRAGFHVLNKANPASMLLRAGVLASMKLNLFKVASRIRFAYWSPEQARANRMDMGKYNQLQRIREKVEKIYFRAGGKPASLKKAILTGKGNRNKMVGLSGLGSVLHFASDDDELREILGDELFYGELEGFEGLQGLGEPASIGTGAAVSAAAAAMATIAGLIKKLGSLFKKGSNAAQKFKIQDNTDNQEEKTRKFSFKNIANKIRNTVQQRRVRKGKTSSAESERIDIPDDEFANDIPEDEFQIVPEDEFMMQDPFETGASNMADNDVDSGGGDDSGSSGSGDSKASDKEKGGLGKWVSDNKVAVGITGGALLLGGGILTAYLVNKSKKAKATKEAATKNGKPVNGVPKKKATSGSTTKKFVPKSRGRKKPIKDEPKIEPLM